MDKCRKPYTDRDKWIVSIISGILFLIIASPYMYTLTDALFSTFGINTIKSSGAPNLTGLLIHTVAFVLIVRLLMK